MKWTFFVGACVVVAGALLKSGVPVIAIAAGVTLAAIANVLRQRRSVSRRTAGVKTR